MIRSPLTPADAGVGSEAGPGPNPHLADAILMRQAPDGALFVGEVTLSDNRLVPYFGNQGAIGLCVAWQETRDARYLTART